MIKKMEQAWNDIDWDGIEQAWNDIDLDIINN